MRRIGRRRALLTLTAGAAAFRAPRACHALPARVAIDTPPLELETRLLISDGRRRQRIVLHHPMRCRRDARGNVSRLVYIRNRRHRLRPGLAVTLRGPRRVRPGTTARYLARVHNRRRRGDRLLSSLWDVTLTGRPHPARQPLARIRELRAGRSRRLVFTIRVPRARADASVPRPSPAPPAPARSGHAPARGYRRPAARGCPNPEMLGQFGLISPVPIFSGRGKRYLRARARWWGGRCGRGRS